MFRLSTSDELDVPTFGDKPVMEIAKQHGGYFLQRMRVYSCNLTWYCFPFRCPFSAFGCWVNIKVFVGCGTSTELLGWSQSHNPSLGNLLVVIGETENARNAIGAKTNMSKRSSFGNTSVDDAVCTTGETGCNSDEIHSL
ncbi:hypothetical protein C5167_023974 [Papaver somniferum]|uniref:Uncharacterized protein n=1 Tax=Papaver somniferum TaxID=3469 RepID=A0A4Y7JR90_PAPSO|nr:hypothetical protein C5167_023974 [Papaver somniferum]